MDGFSIGPTVNPCTKGIWAWSKPVRLNETTDLIILDTEGLNSVCKQTSLITKIRTFVTEREELYCGCEAILDINLARKHVRIQ